MPPTYYPHSDAAAPLIGGVVPEYAADDVQLAPDVRRRVCVLSVLGRRHVSRLLLATGHQEVQTRPQVHSRPPQ